MLLRRLALIVCCLVCSVQAQQIAIVLDDMGNHQREAAAFTLPTQVAFSILPHTEHSTPFALRAGKQQRTVLLHMPMESLNGKALGPGGLTADMPPQRILATLRQALNTVPNALGINNHMGSKLTQLTLPMRTTMAFLREQQMLFIDSRTTRYSKAARIASEQGVPVLTRQVFLDHDQQQVAIAKQFARLLMLAKRDGQALAIAHPHPPTLAFLQQQLPLLPKLGIRLVNVQSLLNPAEQANYSLTRSASDGYIQPVSPD